jgi:hypothetical protein
MANGEMLCTELLLQVIADELYVARVDREHERSKTSEWLTGGGRDNMVEEIEKIARPHR